MYCIIGGGGFLGSALIQKILLQTTQEILVLAKNGQAYQQNHPRVHSLCGNIQTLCRQEPFYRDFEKFDDLKIIYLAAMHNIDAVAKAPQEAYELNVRTLQCFLSHVEAKCLFFSSSDTVYGEGGGHPFRETDKLCPISIYAKQKQLAEQAVLEHGCHVLRLPLMFGNSLSPYKKHFCDQLTQKLLQGLACPMFTDSIRSVLSFSQVAEVIVGLCENFTAETPKILNVAGDEALSKYEIGLRLAQQLCVEPSLIQPARAEGTFLPGAERAQSTIMDNRLLKSVLHIDTLPFQLH